MEIVAVGAVADKTDDETVLVGTGILAVAPSYYRQWFVEYSDWTLGC